MVSLISVVQGSVAVLFWGPLGDSVGRYRILVISSAGIFVFGCISAAATSYEFLYWTRFIVGFFEGGCELERED